ncbi:hypothetical protein GFS31_27620 [Leptolyngbya sp. BL0902]|nr:hypothetical protein GFS31_27620 [Leptolyngbya sp. BL0902]
MADIRQTRFYQESLAEGREGGETAVRLSLLLRRLGSLPDDQVAHIQALRLLRLAARLEVVLEGVLDVADGAALAGWQLAHPVRGGWGLGTVQRIVMVFVKAE